MTVLAGTPANIFHSQRQMGPQRSIYGATTKVLDSDFATAVSFILPQ
jgi:hypothetical protein